MDSLMTQKPARVKRSRPAGRIRCLPPKRHYAASVGDLRQSMAVKRRYFCKSLRIVTLKHDFLCKVVGW